MFTVGIFTSHVPYVLAFLAYALFYFSGTPQLPESVVDASFSQVVFHQSVDCKLTSDSYSFKKYKSDISFFHLRKLLSEKNSAKKKIETFNIFDAPLQSFYLIKFSFLRPPPRV